MHLQESCRAGTLTGGMLGLFDPDRRLGVGPMRDVRIAFAMLCLAGAPVTAQSYAPFGPQTEVPIATVDDGGWTRCFASPYAAPTGLYVPTIQARCPGDKLMLACGQFEESEFRLLAQADWSATFEDPGDSSNDSHGANGAEWYFNLGGEGSGSDSWGFAGSGDSLERGNCDDASGANPELRLCWHLQEAAGGYRCGSDTGLNLSDQWTKFVYTYSTAIFADGFEASGNVCEWSGWSGSSVDCSQTLALALLPICEVTIEDQGPYDLDPDLGEVGYRFEWNNLTRETGYRLQLTHGGLYDVEDDYVELPAGTTQSPIYTCASPNDCTWTYRLMAHVDHAPGHGPSSIAGDVLSNGCTVYPTYLDPP